MKLVKPPATPILIRIVSWVGALVVGGTIVYLVFNFGYYASGLASYEEQQKRRSETPIPVDFSDPNQDPNKKP